jgi:hypothetical protein
MQISVKTPPELTLPILEKCAALDCSVPSLFVSDCTFQCIKWMGIPHGSFEPLPLVEKYYHAVGREDEIYPRLRKRQDALMQRLITEDKTKRTKETARRLAEFKAQAKKQPPSKHLHLKISPGLSNLTERIKEKASWLRMAPNGLVVACLRDCLQAMDDPKKAVVPPPIVVDFWTVSHAKLSPKSANAVDSMVMESYENMLRKRSGPILDTIVRLALSERWDAPLKQVLRDAGIFPQGKVSAK